MRHRVGQRDGLDIGHAVEEHCHRHRSGLRFAPRRVHQPADERVDLRAAERTAVAFVADDFLREHGGFQYVPGAASVGGDLPPNTASMSFNKLLAPMRKRFGVSAEAPRICSTSAK